MGNILKLNIFSEKGHFFVKFEGPDSTFFRLPIDSAIVTWCMLEYLPTNWRKAIFKCQSIKMFRQMFSISNIKNF